MFFIIRKSPLNYINKTCILICKVISPSTVANFASFILSLLFAFVCKRIHYSQCTVLHLIHTYFASTSLSICRMSIAKAMILFLVDRNVEKSFRFPAQGLSISSQEKCFCLLCRLDQIPYSSSW